MAALGLLGLRIFEACGANISDLGEEHGHRVLRVRGKGGKVVLVPLPPAVARAVDRAVDERESGPILRNSLGRRLDRHAVTGATGNTGWPWWRSWSAGASTFGRLPGTRLWQGRFPAEMELVAGTHTAPKTLDAALDGVRRLHLTVTAGVAETGPELIRRAVDAGVRRITVVWGGSVGPAERAVADSGVEWTRLEPQEFMSNTLAWVDSIRSEGVVREPYDFPSALVHEADIGAVAAVALLEDGHAGRAYNLTGPESLTPRERIAVVSRAIGRDITFARIAHEQAIDRLTATGVSRADAECVVGWYAAPSEESTRVMDTVEQVTGRPARTFEQWVAEHADRFHAPDPR